MNELGVAGTKEVQIPEVYESIGLLEKEVLRISDLVEQVESKFSVVLRPQQGKHEGGPSCLGVPTSTVLGSRLKQLSETLSLSTDALQSVVDRAEI